MNSLQEFIIGVSTFINNVLLPFLFALALLFFMYNAFRFFILEGDEKDGREKAKRMALYGVLAFVFLVSIWGIVNLLVNGLGLYGNYPLNPDYLGKSPTPGGEFGPGPTGNSSGWGWGQ